ncbi:MAG: glycosyltransferase family 2 protein, partial [Thermodesulfobacteriota bacterium]
MDKKRSNVSVLTAAYNTEKYIGQAIESVLCQTMPDFEFILRNDGSTDNTLQIINDYAARDSRIKVLSGPNIGMAASTNELIKYSGG